MAQTVVDQLEPVQIQEQHRDVRTVMHRDVQRVFEAVEKIQAVREPGQRIGHLATRDIGHRTRHADCLAALVPDGDSAAQDPDVTAAFLPDAAFRNQFFGPAFDMRGNFRVHPFHVRVV